MKIFKNLTLSFFLFFFAMGCKKNNTTETLCEQKSGFTFCKDTLFVNIQGKLTKAVLYDNKFYTIFEDNIPNNSRTKKKLYIISKAGKIEKEIDLPNIRNLYHYLLKSKNDSIFLKTWEVSYDEDISFYLNQEKNEWEKVVFNDNFLYQDENYYVTVYHYGEFGGTILFEDIADKTLYAVFASGAFEINKLNNKYFITHLYSVWCWHETQLQVIENPREMIEYEITDNKKPVYTKSTEGINNVFWIFDSLKIRTTFVNNNKLYHFYENEDILNIGEIRDSTMVSLFKFEKNISFISYQFLSVNNEFVVLKTELDSISLLLEIDTAEIRIHHIVNI